MQSEIIIDYNASNIFKALSSKTRWDILQLIKNRKLDISRIAEALKQTEANISAQIKILEKAGLVVSHYEPGEHGVAKFCEPVCEKLIIKIIGNSGPVNIQVSKKNSNSKGAKPGAIFHIDTLEEFDELLKKNPDMQYFAKLTAYQMVCKQSLYKIEYCPICRLSCKFARKTIYSTKE